MGPEASGARRNKAAPHNAVGRENALTQRRIAKMAAVACLSCVGLAAIVSALLIMRLHP